MKSLLLVSQSPRRQQLLKNAEMNFSVISRLELTETPRLDLTIDDLIIDLAQQKARQAIDSVDNLMLLGKILLTADTMVVFSGEALGKPKNQDDAIRILRLLSGSRHSVKTGYCLVDVDQDDWHLGIETTEVHFRKLSESEILDYVKTGEPMDKAGAYGIQGEAKEFVSHIDGSYANVVGLPVERLQRIIFEKGW